MELAIDIFAIMGFTAFVMVLGFVMLKIEGWLSKWLRKALRRP